MKTRDEMEFDTTFSSLLRSQTPRSNTVNHETKYDTSKKLTTTINKTRAQNVQFTRQKRYAPPHVTEGFQGVAQTPEGQDEDHDCIRALGHGDPAVDQDQGEEPQCPRQEIYAPFIDKGPVFVTNSKADKSHH